MKKEKTTKKSRLICFAILLILLVSAVVVSCENSFVIAILPSRDAGANKAYTISIYIRGNEDGDKITASPKTGNGGDIITLNYTVANTKRYNLLDLGGVTSPIASVDGAGSGTRTYTVNPDDASNKVITITAIFEHTDLELDPIAFTDPTGHITKTRYIDTVFTNAVKIGYKGSGAITYSSSDTTVATVDGSGQVTIHKSGFTVITAEKAADAVYAYARTEYTLTVNPFVEMVLIPAGSFMMGQTDVATPVHSVTLSAFYMGKYQVTQEQYQAVIGTNPSSFNSNPQAGEIQGKRPVEYVTWYDTVEFCNKLSALEGLQSVYTISGRTPASGYPITSATVTMDSSKNGYRLPTEAQWEYACRAGTTTAYNTGDTINDNTGWYTSNSESKTHQVGLKPANAWGLYDMHGNVWEWCWDWYGSYSSAAQTDPMGASSGTYRVTRGGSWLDSAEDLRAANRYYYNPSNRRHYVGFRLVRP